MTGSVAHTIGGPWPVTAYAMRTPSSVVQYRISGSIARKYTAETSPHSRYVFAPAASISNVGPGVRRARHANRRLPLVRAEIHDHVRDIAQHVLVRDVVGGSDIEQHPVGRMLL